MVVTISEAYNLITCLVKLASQTCVQNTPELEMVWDIWSKKNHWFKGYSNIAERLGFVYWCSCFGKAVCMKPGTMGIMVNGVPREVPRPKLSRRLQGFWPRNIPRDSIHHNTPMALCHTFEFVCHPGLVERDLFQLMIP